MYSGEAKSMKYARATYGSLAYDLKRIEEPEIEIEEAPLSRPKRKTEIRTETRARSKGKAAAKARIAPFSVLGFMAAAFMLVMVLLGNVQLTKISAESSEVQKRITDLKNTEAKMKIQYESTFDLTKVEDYAVGRLGMVPATNSQVYYLKSATPDKAELISDKSNKGIIKNVATFLSRVVEYFK